MRTLYTIGYSGKNAQKFFESLKNHNIKRLIDVRLYNTSQLAGYTKSSDLAYFLEQICGISYTHALCLAPTASLLDKFKKQHISWETYESMYMDILRQRNIIPQFIDQDLDHACLMCSEKHHACCHRSLAAEYLQAEGLVDSIVHL